MYGGDNGYQQLERQLGLGSFNLMIKLSWKGPEAEPNTCRGAWTCSWPCTDPSMPLLCPGLPGTKLSLH